MQYTETVEPTSIARRLMEIREQVAEQLSADLQQMAAENARLQEDYQYEVRLTNTAVGSFDSDKSGIISWSTAAVKRCGCYFEPQLTLYPKSFKHIVPDALHGTC